MASTLCRPTSAEPRTGFRFREVSVTRSKSTRSSLPAPLLARATAAWLPTPPNPTTAIRLPLSLRKPSSPRKSTVRANLSGQSEQLIRVPPGGFGQLLRPHAQYARGGQAYHSDVGGLRLPCGYPLHPH